jgi:hypothetical protein
MIEIGIKKVNTDIENINIDLEYHHTVTTECRHGACRREDACLRRETGILEVREWETGA